jgi:peptide/nickel transport system substrate-binding protein
VRWALLALCLVACSTSQKTGERPIEMLVPNDAETLDPRYATDAVALRTTRLIHAGLVRLNPRTLMPEPYLAKSWTWEDDRTLRVELRTDVRFHSGAPFGAKDVAATIAAVQSPKVGSRHARVVEPIASVSSDGDSAVRITLAHAHATLLTDLEIPILRADEAAGPPQPAGQLDGLGPFKVAAREAGAIVLVPAENAALPKPAHAVTIRTVHDENARALRMHAGRADLVVNGFSPTLLPSVATAPGVSVVARPGANLTYLMVQSERAGAAYGGLISERVDRRRLADTLFAGHATPADTLLPDTLWAHSERSDWCGNRERKPKVEPPVHLTLLTSTDRFRITVARQLAQDLASVGLEIEVIPLELGTMLARLNAGDFDLATLQMPEITEPNVLRFFMHSSNIPPAGANRGRLRDPRIDALLDRAAAQRDPEARKLTYAELETVVREKSLFIPLWHEDQVAVTSARANGFAPSAEGRWLDLAALR